MNQCQSFDKLVDLLGEPIKAFGEESRRGRRTRISQMPYQDTDGKKGMRIQFYLQGSRNRAVVEVDARENESGSMETRYIIARLLGCQTSAIKRFSLLHLLTIKYIFSKNNMSLQT